MRALANLRGPRSRAGRCCLPLIIFFLRPARAASPPPPLRAGATSWRRARRAVRHTGQTSSASGGAQAPCALACAARGGGAPDTGSPRAQPAAAARSSRPHSRSVGRLLFRRQPGPQWVRKIHAFRRKRRLTALAAMRRLCRSHPRPRLRPSVVVFVVVVFVSPAASCTCRGFHRHPHPNVLLSLALLPSSLFSSSSSSSLLPSSSFCRVRRPHVATPVIVFVWFVVLFVGPVIVVSTIYRRRARHARARRGRVRGQREAARRGPLQCPFGVCETRQTRQRRRQKQRGKCLLLTAKSHRRRHRRARGSIRRCAAACTRRLRR